MGLWRLLEYLWNASRLGWTCEKWFCGFLSNRKKHATNKIKLKLPVLTIQTSQSVNIRIKSHHNEGSNRKSALRATRSFVSLAISSAMSCLYLCLYLHDLSNQSILFSNLSSCLLMLRMQFWCHHFTILSNSHGSLPIPTIRRVSCSSSSWPGGTSH